MSGRPHQRYCRRQLDGNKAGSKETLPDRGAKEGPANEERPRQPPRRRGGTSARNHLRFTPGLPHGKGEASRPREAICAPDEVKQVQQPRHVLVARHKPGFSLLLTPLALEGINELEQSTA